LVCKLKKNIAFDCKANIHYNQFISNIETNVKDKNIGMGWYLNTNINIKSFYLTSVVNYNHKIIFGNTLLKNQLILQMNLRYSF
jgi:hypothetical protein